MIKIVCEAKTMLSTSESLYLAGPVPTPHRYVDRHDTILFVGRCSQPISTGRNSARTVIFEIGLTERNTP